jgi:bacillithiol synthase
MQLKDLFDDAAICFPLLVLRNSFLVQSEKQRVHWSQLGFQTADLFIDSLSLENKYVHTHTSHHLSLTEDKEHLLKMYGQLQSKVEKIDTTLREHTIALQKKHLTRIETLEKKMLRAEKRNMNDAVQKIRKIKASLFPDDALQERVENFLPFYARYGTDFFDAILANSLPIEQQFCVLSIESL